MWTNQGVLGDTVNKENDLKDTKQANNAIPPLSLVSYHWVSFVFAASWHQVVFKLLIEHFSCWKCFRLKVRNYYNSNMIRSQLAI